MCKLAKRTEVDDVVAIGLTGTKAAALTTIESIVCLTDTDWTVRRDLAWRVLHQAKRRMDGGTDKNKLFYAVP